MWCISLWQYTVRTPPHKPLPLILSTNLSTTKIGPWIRDSDYFQGLNFLIPKTPMRKWFNLTGNEYLKFVLGFDTKIYIERPRPSSTPQSGRCKLVKNDKNDQMVTFCRVKILNRNRSCSVAWDCKISLLWYNCPMIEFDYFLWFLSLSVHSRIWFDFNHFFWLDPVVDRISIFIKNSCSKFNMNVNIEI